MTENEIETTLPLLKKPLEQYLWLQRRFVELECPERDEHFRRRFCNYYRIFAARRGKDWQNAYFSLFPRVRAEAFDYESCLAQLFELTGNIEASFASKLMATVQPDNVVLDKIVLNHFNLRLPGSATPDRLKRTVETYGALTERVRAFRHSREGVRLIERFRAYSDAYQDAAITEIKIVDLAIWAYRSGASIVATR